MTEASGPNWPGQQPDPWAPGVPPVAQPSYPPGPPLVTIGDISCTQQAVITPSGSIPISEVNWTVADLTRTESRIPPWAIVLAIVFFLFCLLGLLFLLVKETTTTGYLQVTAQGPRFMHTTQIPVSSQAQIADVHARVNYARSLGHAAR
jgi:hypothetical protein